MRLRIFSLIMVNLLSITTLMPLYYAMNRNFGLPAFLVETAAPLLYRVDKALQKARLSNGSNIKLLVGRKE